MAKITDERYTPTRIFSQLQEHAKQSGVELALDVCATKESKKLPKYLTEADDALKHAWDRPYFCNPPWSNIRPFLLKAYQSSFINVNGPRQPGLLLLPAWTDRAWWQELVEPHRDGARDDMAIQTRFTPRIRFGRPGQPELEEGSPNFWCVLLAVGDWPPGIRNWRMEW